MIDFDHKTYNNKRNLTAFDYNKQICFYINRPMRPGLYKTYNIIRMITLSMISISGGYCITNLGGTNVGGYNVGGYNVCDKNQVAKKLRHRFRSIHIMFLNTKKMLEDGDRGPQTWFALLNKVNNI